MACYKDGRANFSTRTMIHRAKGKAKRIVALLFQLELILFRIMDRYAYPHWISSTLWIFPLWIFLLMFNCSIPFSIGFSESKACILRADDIIGWIKYSMDVNQSIWPCVEDCCQLEAGNGGRGAATERKMIHFRYPYHTNYLCSQILRWIHIEFSSCLIKLLRCLT